MMKLVCEDNFLEYAGQGYFQCGRHVKCPKIKNNKVLGFDCLIYIDSLPEKCELVAPAPIIQIETAPFKKENETKDEIKKRREHGIKEDDINEDDINLDNDIHGPGNIKTFGNKFIKSEQIFLECK